MVKEHWYTLIQQHNNNVQKLGLSILKTGINNLEFTITFHFSIETNIFWDYCKQASPTLLFSFSQTFAAYPLVKTQK